MTQPNSNILIAHFGSYDNKAWWDTAIRQEDLQCVYCGQITSNTEAREHIVPEAFGFTQTIYKGGVCSCCNNRLNSKIDDKLINKIPRIAATILHSATKGKTLTDREELGGAKLMDDGSVRIKAQGIRKKHIVLLSRWVSKCVVNMFTETFGSQLTTSMLGHLVNYVKDPRDKVYPFSYIECTGARLAHCISIDRVMVKENRFVTISIEFPGTVFFTVYPSEPSEDVAAIYQVLKVGHMNKLRVQGIPDDEVKGYFFGDIFFD